MARASGDREKASGLSSQEAKTRRAALAATKRATQRGETRPAGRARPAVRGLAASIRRSTRRLNPMAALRAPTMAATIQSTVHHAGHPPAARTMPRNANGRANSVCSNLIISSTVESERRKGMRGILFAQKLRADLARGPPRRLFGSRGLLGLRHARLLLSLFVLERDLQLRSHRPGQLDHCGDRQVVAPL